MRCRLDADYQRVQIGTFVVEQFGVIAVNVLAAKHLGSIGSALFNRIGNSHNLNIFSHFNEAVHMRPGASSASDKTDF